MRYRQVHLDFHTSEKIENIGEKFDKKQFQDALIRGRVDSITLFSKCHHGWAYHPSKANQMHPNLKFDLLKEQIEAAHEIGVKTPVYLSAGLDEKYAVVHRDQVVRNKDESTTWVKDFRTAGYHKLCFNTPYLDYLLEQIKEVVENYDADGIFLDITCVQPCYCQYCTNQLIQEGKDPDNDVNIIDLAEKVNINYMKKVRETIDSVKPGLPVFHNSGHIRRGKRNLAFGNSHLELESLPTAGWGYDHFPVSAAYARTLGMDYLGMTGKFHTSWGEFGGYKHPNALRYEVAISMANGARCSIGDQMHPNGEMNIATYDLIGKAYKEVEEKEEYLYNAKNIADIAVISKEAIDNYYESKDFSSAVSTGVCDEDAGCSRILLEGKYLFNYIDAEEDFSKYKLIILPDKIILDNYFKDKLNQYIKNGGKLIASGMSGTDSDGKFVIDFGCEFDGKNEYNPTYCKPKFEIDCLLNSSYVLYENSYKLKNVTGEVLAIRENPYFNRTIEHFSSHQHAPNNDSEQFPAIVTKNNCVYIGWDIFSDYTNTGSIASKKVVTHIIESVLGEDKSVSCNMPAQGMLTLTEQENRKIVHLLYASPVKRGHFEIIEDIIPLHNINVSVKCNDEVKKVYLAPQNIEIPYQFENGYVKFTVSEFENHQMVVIEK